MITKVRSVCFQNNAFSFRTGDFSPFHKAVFQDITISHSQFQPAFHILSFSQQGFQPLAEVDAAVLQAESGAEGTGRVIVSVAAVVEDKSNVLAVESGGIEAAVAYLLIGKAV